jgi:hypothetical protein
MVRAAQLLSALSAAPETAQVHNAGPRMTAVWRSPGNDRYMEVIE